jgi:hypothetical protein
MLPRQNGYSPAAIEPAAEDDAYPYQQTAPLRGRAVPEKVEPSFDIKLDGQVIGTVYPQRLTGAAQIDLEDAKSTRAVIAWLVTYAGGDAAHVEQMLRALPLVEITNFVRGVSEALSRSIALGNASGPR